MKYEYSGSPQTFAGRHFSGLLVILALFSLITVLAFIGLRKSQESVVLLTRTGEVRNQVLLLRAAVQDAETGQRGFLLTGREAYLAPYNSAHAAIQTSLAALQRLTADSQDQQNRVTKVQAVISEKLAELAQTIDLRRRLGAAEALAVVSTDRGRLLMDQIRTLLEEIRGHEEKLRTLRILQTKRIAQQLQIGLALLSTFTAALLVFGFVTITHEKSLRQAAYNTLSQVEERQKLALAAAEVGTWSWDVETDELLFSDLCKAMFGISSGSSLTYKIFENTLHPDDRQRTSEAVRRSLEAQTEYDISYRVIWPDGSLHWLRAKGKPESDATRKTLRLQGIVIGRDEQERSREALRQSEQRYTALFRNKANAIAHCRSIYDPAGKPIDYEILEVNDAYTAITGLKKEEVEKKTARQVFPGIENFDFDYIGIYGKIAKQGGEQSFEVYFAPLAQWLSVYAYSPIPGEFVVIFTDISARKQSEQALQSSEERLRLAQSAARVGVWEWHPRNEEITFTPELYNLYGLQPGAIQTYADWRRLIHPEDLSCVDAERTRLRAVGGSFDLEYRIRHANGQVRWVYEKGAALPDASGATVRILGVALDISDRKRLEAELRSLNETLERRVADRTEELASANQELEAFCYSVSHDLRTPLRGIDGFARILLTDFASQLQPKPARFLGLIRDNAQRMGHLIDDLLSFSRLSRQAVHKATIHPEPMVRQVLNELQPERAGRLIHVSIGEMPSCQAEPSMLKQVWLNLISNAIKFTSRLESAEIEIGYGPSAAFHAPAYFVRDNGAGFDMRYAAKLFGIFQRLHRAEDYEGTGVGLAIVARIVHRHGGEVHAFGEPNRGATISFTLNGA